jgi:hypothetical protein
MPVDFKTESTGESRDPVANADEESEAQFEIISFKTVDE